MSKLTRTGKATYGTEYSISGMIPLTNIPNLSSLSWGDVLVDNNGKGKRWIVHECTSCDKRFLRSLIALVPVDCSDCQQEKKFENWR